MKFYKSKVATKNQEYFDVAVINIDDSDIALDSKSVSDDPIHHIQILDRSGSMYGDIDKLIENVKDTIRSMKKNDYYSIIWFSGSNEFRTILKGVSCDHSQDNEFKVLDSIKSVLGLTCFSDATTEAIDIVCELKDLCNTVSITLFTDGMSTVSGDNQKMYNLMNKISSEYGDRIISFNTIGYGDYCNETILKDWSDNTQYGIFTHQSNINEYLSIFNENKETISDLSSNILSVELNKHVNMYYVTDKFVKRINSDNFKYTKCSSTKNQIILVANAETYTTMDEIEIKINDIVYALKDVDKEINDNWFDSIFYKIAYAEYMAERYYVSLDYLSLLGDKNLIDEHMNSFNNFEKSKHVSSLKKAMRYTKYRNPREVSIDYIPDPNVPCLIDLLTVLSMNKCIYNVDHSEYTRITRKVTDNFNMFTKTSSLARIEDIVFNEERLNVSLRVRIDGYVKINPRQAESVELMSKYPCSIFRTYTIIKDGNLNVKEIEVTTDKDYIKDYIKEKFGESIVSELNNNNNNDNSKTFVLNLTCIPVVNRSYNNLNINQIYNKVKDITIYKSYLKVIKYLISQISKDSDNINSNTEGLSLTMDQIKLLNEYSIKNGIYYGIDNETPVVGDCDFYIARIFKFYIKGFSSSSVLSPVARVIDGKYKKSDKYMIQALDRYGKVESLTELKEAKKVIETRIVEDSKVLSASKIANVLTGSFYSGTVYAKSSKDDIFQYKADNGDILCIKTGESKEYF